MNTPLQLGDTVRYSTTANRHYGFTKAARARTATVVAVFNGYVTVRWGNEGGDRNIPNWALQLVNTNNEVAA